MPLPAAQQPPHPNLPPTVLWVPGVLAIGTIAVFASGANTALFVALQGLTGHLPDSLWAFLTDQAGVLSVAAWATLALWAKPAVAAAILLSWPAGLLVVRGLKHLLAEARPAQVLPPESLHVIGRELSSLSFPSGHTATAFAVAAAVLYCLDTRVRRRLYAPVLVLAMLMALSRIGVGAHWPVDVLAGAAIGWLCGLSGVLWAAHWRFWQHRQGLITLTALGLLAGILRLTLDSGYPQVHGFALLLGAGAIIAALAFLLRLRTTSP